ncbi:ferrichrome ABC transporter substrate-binding protein [Methylopila jiangsuensis]|uniref:Ferrichrome ABC transporter substrate-binding protein n=1 Tax=Methylopila jiangsuensis TaxID=586230 RepID=A0A9W6JI16_9HYPH|nr:ABC transporter substrate-binding protein [Methylopila jiangsuensis]MDR6285188.1 iron complex transport system substrate-binding protein [Methylopila jiangsuensis]GLK77422.1 ferrichrome ABC transporter substrate-binding protein [Methylopila jiangsuensis]
MTPTAPALTRRAALLAGAGLLAAPALGRAAEAIEIRDVAGRTVRLDRPARRIVLSSWVSLDALALLHPEPVSLLAGWQGAPGAVLDEGFYEAVLRRFPEARALPAIGRFSLDGGAVETVLGLEPDLLVLSMFDAFGMGGGATNPQIAAFEAAGVPVLIVDFFLDPLGRSEESLLALGRAIGREEAAAAYNAFYRGRRERVTRTVAAKVGDGARPAVFMHVHAASPDCCYSPGHATLNAFIRLAGGHNIGADALPGATGQLSLEYVLSRDPDVYVATGGYQAEPGRFTLGRGVSDERARAGFASVTARPGLSGLRAVASGRAYGLWHSFAHSPAHVVAIELLARWFQPELFSDIDPKATLDEINARFAALPLTGALWVETGPS